MNNDWLEDYVLQFMKSPSWAGPIQHFIDEKCSIFEVTHIEENKLEYTIVHNEFNELVESLLVAHLVDVDVTPDQFATAFEASVLAAQSDSGLSAIVSQIVSVSDFGVFKQMMIERHRGQQQAIAGSPVVEAVPAPESAPAAPSVAAPV